VLYIRHTALGDRAEQSAERATFLHNRAVPTPTRPRTSQRIPTGDVVDRNDPETTRDQRFPW
jgi:hypothetical protein